MEITIEQQLCDKLKFSRKRNDALHQQVLELQALHHYTLNCLKGVLKQLKSGVDRNVVISDIEQYIIEQYIKDLGGVE